MKLGVNIDHVATLREVRKTIFPDPVKAAAIAEKAGADGITVHLREDRRHIQERDVILLMKAINTKLNLEMAVADDVVEKALEYKPQCACLVPEKREELTTEGGLDVCGNVEEIARVTNLLQDNDTIVSLFIDPSEEQIKASLKTGAKFIELHTGEFANAKNEHEQMKELDKLIAASELAHKLGIRVNAGHGLNYHNVSLMHKVPHLEELNIGHSIIARSVFTGLEKAVREMKELIEDS